MNTELPVAMNAASMRSCLWLGWVKHTEHMWFWFGYHMAASFCSACL